MIREGQVGDVLAVYSSDSGSRTDIPLWVAKAGHRLVGITTRDGYDEIVVEKAR
jgi:TusA-related sulfurtransferase